MSEFKPGDMVECLKVCYSPFGETIPVPGRRYTVRSLRSFGASGLGLHLREIRNSRRSYANGRYEAYFSKNIFRLIKPRATDISIFHKIVKEAMKTGKVTA